MNTTLHYDLVYVSAVSRRVVLFRKISETLFEASDGTKVSLSKLKLHYRFHSELINRNKERWNHSTNQNGFKIKTRKD